MDEAKKIPTLIRHILKSKGVQEEDLNTLEQADICSKEDFTTVGDSATLKAITGLSMDICESVMHWALGTSPITEQSSQSPQAVIVESADVVKCVHCGAKQPKDYKTGDLCLSCGDQAEPVLTCHWCHSSGPGDFCRSCGSEFVSASDYEIAIYLKNEGESKSSIVKMIKTMSPAEKNRIWSKVRKH